VVHLHTYNCFIAWFLLFQDGTEPTQQRHEPMVAMICPEKQVRIVSAFSGPIRQTSFVVFGSYDKHYRKE
jgi:hypothetical protein